MGQTGNIHIRINIQPIFWQEMTVDMEVTYNELNNAVSVNFAGLATGCIIFIPFAKKVWPTTSLYRINGTDVGDGVSGIQNDQLDRAVCDELVAGLGWCNQ